MGDGGVCGDVQSSNSDGMENPFREVNNLMLSQTDLHIQLCKCTRWQKGATRLAVFKQRHARQERGAFKLLA